MPPAGSSALAAEAESLRGDLATERARRADAEQELVGLRVELGPRAPNG